MWEIGLSHYLTVAAILFTLGIFGIFLNRKNVIIILMSVELMLLAVNINLVAFSTYLGDMMGQVFALFVLTVAAAEAAIGLAILVVFFRNRGSIDVEDIPLVIRHRSSSKPSQRACASWAVILSCVDQNYRRFRWSAGPSFVRPPTFFSTFFFTQPIG